MGGLDMTCVKLVPGAATPVIRYTLDNTQPTPLSAVYDTGAGVLLRATTGNREVNVTAICEAVRPCSAHRGVKTLSSAELSHKYLTMGGHL